MFREISTITLFSIIAGIILHGAVFPPAGVRLWHLMDIIKMKVRIFTMFFLERKLGIVGRGRKLAFLLGMLCFAILFITGFGPVLLFGIRLSGYLLMIHVTFAGVFVVCTAFLTVTSAQKFTFDNTDLSRLCGIVRIKFSCIADSAGKSCTAQKILFWLLAVLTLPLALSSIISMFPVFGTSGQELLFELHRYTALVFAGSVLLYIYLLVRLQLKNG